nr:MAG TPA: hypothetical protein [Caudoviricetes sp.]
MRGPRNSGASGRESSGCSSTHPLTLSKLNARVLLILIFLPFGFPGGFSFA